MNIFTGRFAIPAFGTQSGSRSTVRKHTTHFEYVSGELPDIFTMANIIVPRAGATNILKLLALKKPSPLIPYALNASRGNQIITTQSLFESRASTRFLSRAPRLPHVFETPDTGIRKP